MAVCLGVAAMTLPLTVSADDQPTPPSAAPAMSSKEKVSYSVGMYIANSIIKRNNLEVDVDVMSAAIKDVLSGHQTRLTDAQMQETLMAYEKELRAKREQQRLELAEKNHKEGEAFLAANKSKEGVKTRDVKLPDGTTAQLQYKVLAEGSGETPTSADTAIINIKSHTIGGKEIENTPTRRVVMNRPQLRALGEALPLMKKGAKWELYVPSGLAYGDSASGAIEPGTTLIYDVELTDIESPQPMTSDIIMVPSTEQMKAGSNIVVIKPSDAARFAQTNNPAPTNPAPKKK
jgi:FKBP-type peptidyl-prolyl cis-trans isomerase FklB